MFNDYRPYISEIFAILISSLCWYFGNGLTGSAWWLVWIAPYPLLSYSLFHSGRKTFFVSLAACFIGRLSWFGYLTSVVGMLAASIFTIALALAYAGIISWSVRLVKMYARAWTVFVYPVFFTTFEFLVSQISVDGTAGSLAYSQSNALLIIQIASLTGVVGISFLISLLPSALAVTYWLKYHHRKYVMALLPAMALTLAALVFSWQRISDDSDGKIRIGMVSLDEQLHDMSKKPDSARAMHTIERYLQAVSKLADEGAKLVLLPERAIFVDSANLKAVINSFSNLARTKRIYVISGYTNQTSPIERNSALVIDEDGQLAADYDKIHLVRGLEQRFTPGAGLGVFQIGNHRAGVPICKDMDFPDYISEYGQEKTALLTVPAWDFERDDWLHARMAILRSVENGFSMARAAREGRLTINDQFGRVLQEASTARGIPAALVGEVPVKKIPTIYDRHGDWFGWLNTAFAIFFIVLIGVGLRKPQSLSK